MAESSENVKHMFARGHTFDRAMQNRRSRYDQQQKGIQRRFPARPSTARNINRSIKGMTRKRQAYSLYDLLNF